MSQMNLSTEKKQLKEKENKSCVCKGEGEGVEWTGSLGLVVTTIAFGVDKQ